MGEKISSGEYCDLDDDEEEEEIYDSLEAEDVDRTGDGKVSWILNKGWGIGKKLLVTGAVISSAPFVLPPLVVTSAIAFACCVPSGVVLASYACSEKLMSKLLRYNGGSSEGVSMWNEEEEEFEDAFGIEGLRDEYLVDENVVDDGADVFDEFNVIEGEGDTEEFGVVQIEVTSCDGEAGDFVKEEELVTETKGLLEKIRDEARFTGSGMEMDERYAEEIEGSRTDIDDLLDNNVVSDEVEVFVSNAIEGDGEIVIEEIEGKEIEYGEPELASYDKATDVGLEKQIGTAGDGVRKESEELNQARHAKVVSEDKGSVLESEKADNTKDAKMAPKGEIKISNHTLKAEKPITPMEVGVAVVSTIVEETLAPVIKEEARRRTRRGKNNIKQVKSPLIKEEEFEEVSSKESTDATISSAKDDLHSKGVLSNEDKIWEQIHAMQSIVGYTGTPRASCIEELKALYIFNGVEPPTSLNDPHDFAQVDDKIRFLKSIIGVKPDRVESSFLCSF